MDLKAAIDIIIKDLNEARDIIDDLKKYPGIPVFQVELARAKCKSAADVISLLRDLNETNETPATHNKTFQAAASKSEMQEKPAPEQKPAEESFQSSVHDPDPFEIIIAGPAAEVTEIRETIIEETRNKTIEETNEIFRQETREVTVQTTRKPAESSILADQFLNRPVCFNEKLGSSISHDDDVSEILKTKPLSNLSEAIGINDKFLFIREIFNGSSDKYNQAIGRLDSVGNLSDARAVIMSYTGENTDSEAVRQLMDLLKRKLQRNE